MKIGCDIGNVIRDNATGLAILDSIESLKELQNKHKLFFISKAKEHYRQKAKNFLLENGLENIPIFFVYEDDQKIGIGNKLQIDVMIDDKMTILKDFGDSVIKIWFQQDQSKIDGCRKYQKEIFEKLIIAKNWNDILNIIYNQINRILF